MKLLIVIITLLVLNIEKQETPIYGQWKLTKIEINQDVLRPEQRDYFLTITKELITYNLEINKCQTKDFTVTDKQISYDDINCTEICCDGKNDSISNFINYHGFYEIQQNKLIITTADSKLFLERFSD